MEERRQPFVATFALDQTIFLPIRHQPAFQPRGCQPLPTGPQPLQAQSNRKRQTGSQTVTRRAFLLRPSRARLQANNRGGIRKDPRRHDGEERLEGGKIVGDVVVGREIVVSLVVQVERT